MSTLNQRLTRSRRERMISGVAGGIGQYLSVDPVFIRLLFIVLSFSGIGPLIYLILWVVMPEEPVAGTTPAGGPPAEGLTQVFVAPGAQARQPRFDPMTGAPLEPEREIPVNNVGAGGARTPVESRSRLLGTVLIGLGLLLVFKMLLPGLMPLLVPGLLIAGGVWLLRRGK